jgi:hypothetical protein
MTMLENAAETAKELGISEETALVLEFAAALAWAKVYGNNKQRAILGLGLSHAMGNIDGDTMHKQLSRMN